ncbi:hypothetical protein SeMB42_g07826 [Synchytrium endobioticum]|uniref:Superoxide dismutase 1 copper chaperone n=1 Tax=Synchytrium endobioticum TaxID=286115 RepID=A0A507C0H8_9FUNG|nr:hypothetical protein SeMB42_g07826 [Synchytrium endobioticum]
MTSTYSAATPRTKPVTTEFAVAMECNKCVDSVRKELSKNPNVRSIDISLPDQRLVVTATTPPSHLYSTLKNLGRTVVFRGLGTGRPSNAAVCIFEHFPGVARGWAQHNNRGVARLVQLDHDTCMIDVSVHGLVPGTHAVRIRECGDITAGCHSTGSVYAEMGDINVDATGRGELVAEVNLHLHDVIGRAMTVECRGSGTVHRDAICGVLARSAGLFENVKRVCTCSGMTLWQESKNASL